MLSYIGPITMSTLWLDILYMYVIFLLLRNENDLIELIFL